MLCRAQAEAHAAAGRRSLTTQQQLQHHLLHVAFATEAPTPQRAAMQSTNIDAAAGDAAMDDGSDGGASPVQALAERLLLVPQESGGRVQAAKSASRFAAHFGLALVALGVVPRQSGAQLC